MSDIVLSGELILMYTTAEAVALLRSTRLLTVEISLKYTGPHKCSHSAPLPQCPEDPRNCGRHQNDHAFRTVLPELQESKRTNALSSRKSEWLT